MKQIAAAIFGMVAMVGAADAKTLVAYYSRSGNTGAVADIIKNATGADIFEIKTADANHYPTEYRATTETAKNEINSATFPAIVTTPDMTEYDTVFIGTPCWWGTMAGPVHTFLSQVDMSGKTVIPFNTHEGSGVGSVHSDIEKLTPNSTHKTGIAIWGNDASDAGDTINKWLTEIGIK